MLNWASATRVFVATRPIDLRASYNKLFALTESVLKENPLSGHWFVFTNQERNRVKVLFWDGSGLWVCAKRLEQGRFSWPCSQEACAHLRSEGVTGAALGPGSQTEGRLVAALKYFLNIALGLKPFCGACV